MYPTPPNVIPLPAAADHFGGAWDRAECVVLHHTGGTDSRLWLTRTSRPPVSVHVLIDKAGAIYRIVPDGQNAWHVGGSNLGRHTTAAGDDGSANEICLGIELENLGDGRDPYPEAQRDACAWQIAQWWQTYGPLPVLTHGLIDAGHKYDPAGLDLLDVLRRALRWYDAAPATPAPRYTADSPICGLPPAVLPAELAGRIAPTDHYTAYDIRAIVTDYVEQALLVGVDPIVAIAQMCHETAWTGAPLTSFWAQRPQRNPAGIGVTGAWSDAPQPGYAYNPQRRRWEAGLSFPAWATASIPAHLGRLLAYATRPAARTPEQQRLVDQALRYRALPAAMHGSAPALRQLGAAHNPTGQGWASPGDDYGARIAAWANRLIGGGS